MEIDVVAPGVKLVTHGLNEIITEFHSTSGATPHVTGVAALMLSVNNDIKGEAVRNIIRRTAQRGSDPNHDYDTNSWFSSTGPRNNYMGHGVIDATECVKIAGNFETGEDILDLHMRNSFNDYGVEPDNVTRHANYVLWDSPDIWVRKQLSYNYVHQNPEYNPSQNSTVYVRVINRSNRTLNPNEAKVILYWSKLVNTKLWPDVWVGDVSIQGLPVGGIIPNDYGGLDGKPNVSTVKPGEEFVVTFQWDVPNPDDFVGKGFDFDKCDFSLLARVITASDPIDPIAESANIWANVKNSNNIAWKSVTVENGNGDDCPDKGISISNFDDESKVYSLEFSVDDTEIGKAIYEEAEVIIQLQESLYQKWAENGSIKENLIENNNQSFKVIGNHVIIDNIPLASQEVRSFKISFNFLADELTEKDEFKYHFLQREKITSDIISGKTFYIKKGLASTFEADAGNDKEIDKNESVTLSAEWIDEPATYNWYDSDGNLISTGMNVTLSPELTKQYTLEIIKDSDSVKDYDQVIVEVNPFVFGVISPNPATNQININYIAEDANSAYFMITEQTTGNSYNHIIDTVVVQKTIDVSSYPTGIYLVSLVCDGNLIETKQLLID